MAGQTEQTPPTGHLKRRGLIAAAAALAAGVATAKTAPPVAAGADGDVVLGSTANSSGNETRVTKTTQYGAAFSGFGNTTVGTGLVGSGEVGISGIGDYMSGVGVEGSGNTGIYGTSAGGPSSLVTYGVVANQCTVGVSGSGNDTGVRGTGDNYGVYGNSNLTGVYGTASGTGVAGNGNTGVYGSGSTGVYGSGTANGIYGSTTNASAFAVSARASGAGSYGVYSTTLAAASIALGGYAYGPGSYGVYGTSASSHGVYGITAAPGAAAVYGTTSASGAAAISGTAGSGAYAGAFTGPVVVNGQFVAYGGGKSAAVPHPDGSYRLLYCMESPESWFEDFGEGTLVAGKAAVTLDADFAAVVDTSKLHVFLTPHDEAHHLAVKTRTGSGFTVAAAVSAEALGRGTKASDLTGTFSYRVVAKRKDIHAERLATFTPPKVDTTAPPAPPTPAPPKTPEPFPAPPRTPEPRQKR